MTKIAIFASGSGSNAENIFNYFSTRPQVEVSLIVCNRKEAFVFERARRLGVEAAHLSTAEITEGEALLSLLQAREIEWIVLAGFLVKIPDYLIKAYPDRILNIHPALLPKFGGKGMYGDHVHRAVVASGEQKSGITIHYVNQEYDKGAIVAQFTCPVHPSDTFEEVGDKVHALEYAHFPKVIDEVISSAGR